MGASVRRLVSRGPRPWRLRDVVIFTAPLFLLVLYMLGGAVLDAFKMSQYRDWWSAGHRKALLQLRTRWWSTLRLPRAIALEHELSAEDSRLDSIDVRLDSREWDALQRDPMMSWGEGIDADVVRGGDLQRVELRLRGDTSAHWTAEKKTLRLRTSKAALLEGRRDLVFSVKFPLGTHLAASMAHDFGLLGHESEIVSVFLNDRFYGLSRCYSPLGESFLRRSLRMPGNIFRGEAETPGERFRGVEQCLFTNPYIWDRCATNDRPGATGDRSLFGWLRDLSGSTLEEHRRFMSWMDRDELSRYLAMLLVCGDVWHNNDTHNQFWYEDPSTGRFHPIVWDVNLQSVNRALAEEKINRFWRVVLRDPHVLAGALEVLHERLEAGELLARIEERIRELGERHEAAIGFDRLRRAIPRVGNPPLLLEVVRRNLALVEGRIREARAALAVVPTSPGEWVVDVETRSWSGVELARIELRGSEVAEARERRIEVVADVDLDGRRGPGDARWPLALRPDGERDGVLALVPLERARMLSNVRAARQFAVEPLHYRWFVTTDPPAEALDVDLVNAITGEPAAVEPLVEGERIARTWGWHPWQYRDDGPPPADLRWSGDVHLREDVVVPAGSTLRIEPGTRVALDPDVSILVKGRLVAEGRPEARIELCNADAGLPWGTLALQGAGASGSRVAHVLFVGGGGALLERVEYKGMVCVHWARDVRFVDCELTGNMRCDDAFNAVHADVDLIFCWFHDTNGDGVDYDISTGTIRDCRIERARNDGIDLMTCRPVIASNEIVDCRDKGISIGEDAAPVVFDNRIAGCDIGVEVKDRSAPLVVHDEITGNRVGVLARRKNWRYGRGGWPRLVRSRVTGNTSDLELDATSRITRFESLIGDARAATPAADGPGSAGRTDLEWALGPAGLAAEPAAAGRARGATEREPLSVLDERRFAEDFRSPEREWSFGGGVRRILKRDGDLVAYVRGERGRLASPCEWDLDDPSVRHLLVLEVRGEELSGVRVRLVAREGEAASDDWRPVDWADGSGEYAYSWFEVPAGAYRGIELEVEPRGRGCFALNGWRLIAVPVDGRVVAEGSR